MTRHKGEITRADLQRNSHVVLPAEFQFVINLKTTKVLGLASPLQPPHGWPHLRLAHYRACAVAVDLD
jgi:hypothetical protein